VYEIRWPQGYLDFLSFFAVFACDLFGTIKLGCIVPYDADSAMYCTQHIIAGPWAWYHGGNLEQQELFHGKLD
jgi:hypothetical protein